MNCQIKFHQYLIPGYLCRLGWAAKLISANIFEWPFWSQITKFNAPQYFHFYGIFCILVGILSLKGCCMAGIKISCFNYSSVSCVSLYSDSFADLSVSIMLASFQAMVNVTINFSCICDPVLIVTLYVCIPWGVSFFVWRNSFHSLSACLVVQNFNKW